MKRALAWMLATMVWACGGTTPTAPTPTPAPTDPAPAAELDPLWLALVYGGDRGARAMLMREKLWAMPVRGIRDEHRADVGEVMTLLSERLFDRPWRPDPAGPAYEVSYTADTDWCGLATIGAPRIWLADPCVGRIGRKAFRAVFAHEVAHTLGFHHDDSLPGGLMNSALDGANPPDRDAAPLALEATVARCAFQHLQRGDPFRPFPCA